MFLDSMLGTSRRGRFRKLPRTAVGSFTVRPEKPWLFCPTTKFVNNPVETSSRPSGWGNPLNVVNESLALATLAKIASGEGGPLVGWLFLECWRGAEGAVIHSHWFARLLQESERLRQWVFMRHAHLGACLPNP